MLYKILFLIPILLTGFCKSEKATIFDFSKDWNYRLGFERHWLKDNTTSIQTNQISFPENLSKKLGHKSGYIYITKQIPEEAMEHIKAGQTLSLNMGRVLDVSSYYINGELFARMGLDYPYKTAAMRPFMREIPHKYFKLNEPNYIQIALYTDGSFPLQIMDEVKLGRSDSVYIERNQKELIVFFFLITYLVAGVYHILLAIKRPKDIHNFYYGLFMLVASIYLFIANTVSRDILFEDRVYLQRKLEHVFLFSISPIFTVFLSQYFLKKYNKVSLYLAGFCYLLVIATLFTTLEVMRICSVLWQISNVFLAPYLIYFMNEQIKKGNKDARYLIISLVIMLFGVLFDILISIGFIKLPFISNYTFFLFVVGIATIMANKFMTVTNDFESLTIELEKKVDERTEELQNTLFEVQKLKEQQDGDYYLTSLLVKPLTGNFTNEKEEISLKVEIFIKQKKRFEFRKKINEIGGDICIAETIKLRGESFTVFTNADAMGKSMQGAGGALVYGTAFKSIIERTMNNKWHKNLYPELWLEECYLELQRVFITFDGSMLVSAIIGLIDNDNGTLYYINAEHPYFIIYRDNRAVFIDNMIDVKKIGIVGSEKNLKVIVEQLYKDDAVISGSDGKDDLFIGLDDEGNRIINENENLFLRLLEKNNGEIKGIDKVLENMGEITDDLSLMKLSFYENPLYYDPDPMLFSIDEAQRMMAEGNLEKAIALYLESLLILGENPVVLSSIADIYLKKKDYKKAGEILEKIANITPTNSSIIYLCSFVKKKNKEYEMAAIYGERFKLRNPKNVLNLINLADIYRLSENFTAAKNLLDRALSLEPENDKAIKLLKSMEGSLDTIRVNF